MSPAVGRAGSNGASRKAIVLVVAAAVAVAALMLGDVYTTSVAFVVLLVAVAVALLPLTWSIPLLLFGIPLRFYVTYPGTELDVALTNFIVVGLGIVCFSHTLLHVRPRLLLSEWLVVLWAAWSLLSLLWTTALVPSLRGVFQWLMVFSAIILAARAILGATEPERVVRRFLIALLCAVSVWSVIGFVQMAAGMDAVLAFLRTPAAAVFFAPGLLVTKVAAMNFNWLSGTDVQPFGPFINSIEFGIFTAVGIGAAIALALGRLRTVPRWLVAVTLVMAVAANLACLKATGWVAAGVAITVAFLTLGRSVARVVAVSLGTILVLGGLLFVFRQDVSDRLQSLAVREGATGATAEALTRPAIWLSYLDAVRDRPFVGAGISTATERGPIHWTRTPTGGVVAGRLPTENSYLTALVETGVVGLALLLTTLFGAVVIGVRLSRRYPENPLAQGAGVAAIGLAALLAGNVTVDAFNGEILGVIMGMLVGIVLAASRLVPRVRSQAAA